MTDRCSGESMWIVPEDDCVEGGGGIDALTKNCPTTNGYQSDVVVVADFFAETGTQGCTDQCVRAADLDPGSAPSLVPGGGGILI